MRLKTLTYDFKTTGVKKDEGENEGKVEEEEEGSSSEVLWLLAPMLVSTAHHF